MRKYVASGRVITINAIEICKTAKDTLSADAAVFVNELPDYLGASKRERITVGLVNGLKL